MNYVWKIGVILYKSINVLGNMWGFLKMFGKDGILIVDFVDFYDLI